MAPIYVIASFIRIFFAFTTLNFLFLSEVDTSVTAVHDSMEIFEITTCKEVLHHLVMTATLVVCDRGYRY